jgi:hypothetical protein
MRKLLALAVVGAFLVPAAAFADIEFSSTKRVQVAILPTIAVSNAGADAVLGSAIQTGNVTLQVPFRIDANTQFIMMQAFATDLFKADAGTVGSQSVHRIFHTGTVGVVVDPAPDPEAGGVVGANGPSSLAYAGSTAVTFPTSLGIWEFYPTTLERYESGIRGRFSHDLRLGVTWRNLNSELPQGNYSGFVRLFAQVVI